MTVSGTISTTVFDTNRVIDAAYRRCKIPAQRITSEMQQIALDILHLMMSSTPSKGFQLWATDRQTLTLTASIAALTTPAGTIDIVSAVLATNGYEIPLARVSQDSYDALPNKLLAGRPVQYWLDRQRDVPIMMIWPTPDATYAASTIIIRRKRQLMDVGTLTQTLDVPQRWLEAIVAQLAWRLAMETPEVDGGLAGALKGLADEAYKTAQAEERDDSPMRIVPRIGGYTR